MAVLLQHCDRRDQADRKEFGEAAYGLCLALRGSEKIRDSRFYSVTRDRIVYRCRGRVDGGPRRAAPAGGGAGTVPSRRPGAG